MIILKVHCINKLLTLNLKQYTNINKVLIKEDPLEIFLSWNHFKLDEYLINCSIWIHVMILKCVWSPLD